MNGPLEWFGAIGAIIAAGMIAADIGRKVTGFAFILFCAVSVSWIIAGWRNDTTTLVVQNALLLVINAVGVWQYLLSRKNRMVMERMEKVEDEIVEEVEEELDEDDQPKQASPA